MEEVLTPVDVLKDYGIGAITIKKLKKHNILFLEDVVLFNPEELQERLNIQKDDLAARIVRVSRELLREKGVIKCKAVKAIEFKSVVDKRERFTTGLKKLDDVLGGGITEWDIYEFAGEFGSGKTQLAHQLCVTVQLPPSRDGLGASAIFIDTEGTFRPSRIEDIAERFQMDGKEVLNNIWIVRPATVDELEDIVIREVKDLFRENVRLVVIDSIIALYRAEFKGRGMLAARQQRINYLIDWLKRYAYKYGVSIVYTNQVLSQPVPWGTVQKTPTGGNIIAHAATHRFVMRYSAREDKGYLECIDSPVIPRGTTINYRIAKGGLEDV